MSANSFDGFNPNLNQNLWGLVVSLGSLGVAEYLKLSTLFWFSIVISVVMTLSVGLTTYAYTMNYWEKRTNKKTS
jgi:putative effector of murein hydrolase LrgA (UPF0299 family)